MPLFQSTGGLSLKTYGAFKRGNLTPKVIPFKNVLFELTGVTGRFGPSVLPSYGSNVFQSAGTLVRESNGVQQFTLPVNCILSIVMCGGNGFTGSSNYRGGQGRVINFEYHYNAGEVINCVVGQGGQKAGSGGCGGGASWMWSQTASSGLTSFRLVSTASPNSYGHLIAVAGGGGGGGHNYGVGGDAPQDDNSNFVASNSASNAYYNSDAGRYSYRTKASNPSLGNGGNHGPYAQENSYSNWNANWNAPAGGGIGFSSDGADIKDTTNNYYNRYIGQGGTLSSGAPIGGYRWNNTYSWSTSGIGGFGGGGGCAGNGTAGGGGGGYTGGNGGGNYQGGDYNAGSSDYGHGGGAGGGSKWNTNSRVWNGNGLNETITQSRSYGGLRGGSTYGSASYGSNGYIRITLSEIANEQESAFLTA